jgi:IS5 family transposase
VQGVEGPDRELWDAAQVVGHLVSAGSMFGFLADHRAEVFPDEQYADLFSVVGRPSLPATRMAAVMVLQALHGLSDRECAEAVRCDLRWKVACGLSLLDEGFDPSSLVYWRRRIAKSERPHRVNDAVRQVVEATGVLRGRRRRAVDSTILDDAVATQDTITQLIGAIRRVGREVPGAGEVIAAVCTGHDYSGVGKPRIDWMDPAAKDALVCALVGDANAVVAAFAEAELDEPAAAALALLALVAGQDVEPAEDSDGRDGRWRIARKVAPDRVISTVDPQARHTRKSQSNRKDGYRAHMVAEPETGLITDEALTMAAGADNSDAAIAQKFLTPGEHTPGEQGGAPSGDVATGADPAPGSGSDTADEATTSDDAATDDHAGSAAATDTAAQSATDDTDAPDRAPAQSAAAGSRGQDETLTWYGDSAYGTGELRGEIEGAGHRAVIKPKPVQPAVAGGFTLDDFTVDEGSGTVTCPASQTRPLSATRTVTFGALCRDCPLRAACTTAKAGRTMVLHERDDLLRAARADWAADPALREDYRTYRPNVERTVSQVATQSGRRIKLRYRGTTKNNAWLKYRTAALNLRNLIGRGLTRVNRTWVLAT